MATFIKWTCFFWAASLFGEMHCEHFWKASDGRLIPSFKTVGVDVGQAPPEIGTKEGVYHCTFNLNSSSEKYIYIGEVGDASLAYIGRVELPEESRLYRHGWLIDGLRYMRVIPFFISAEDFFKGPGTYRLRIEYVDIISPQVGIRSGLPTIENFSGVLKRIIFGDVRLAYSVSLGLILFGIFLRILFGSMLSGVERTFALTSLLTTLLCLVSITAFPRVLYNPAFAVRLNDFSGLFACGLSSLLVIFISSDDLKWRFNSFVCLYLAVLTAVFLLLLTMDPSTTLYLRIYFSTVILSSIFPPLTALFKDLFYQKSRYSYRPNSSRMTYILYLIHLIGVFSIDGINVFFMEYAWGSAIQYFYFPVLYIGFFYFREVEGSSNTKMLAQLEELREKCMLLYNRGKFDESLDVLLKEFSFILNAHRSSMIQKVEDGIRIISFSSVDFKPPVGTQPLSDRLREVFASKEPILSSGPVIGGSGKTDILYLPFYFEKMRMHFVVCMTNFDRGGFCPFYLKRLNRLVSWYEQTLSLIQSIRYVNMQNVLIRSTRGSVHELQLESEKYCLMNLDISQESKGAAFILADVDQSSALFELYGGRAVTAALDASILELWNRFKDYGFTVRRQKGDELYLLFMHLRSDNGPKDAYMRALQVALQLQSPGPEMRKATMNAGVAADFSWKIVLSALDGEATSVASEEYISSFHLLGSHEINRASRILTDECNRGELLVTEIVAPYLADRLQSIGTRRLRGMKSESAIELFKVAS